MSNMRLITNPNSGGNIVGGGALSQPNGMTNEIAKEFITRELHTKLRQSQEMSLVTAMTNPKNWLTTRQAEWDRIENQVAGEFATEINRYFNAGYTYDESREKALAIAQVKLDILLSDLEIRKPGANTIFQSALNTQMSRDSRFALANGSAEGTGIPELTKAQRKQIAREEKARRKAKKGGM